MTAQRKETEQSPKIYPIVVIGNGPVGVFFINELIRRGYQQTIAVFGEETHAPYNRVQLSAFLNGDNAFDHIQNPLPKSEHIVAFEGIKIIEIDRDNQRLVDQYGQTYFYETLVLATGSSPHIPDIPGIHSKGVYCFRDLTDTLALFSRKASSRHTVVLGGGLLGLEAARAMLKYSTDVTLLHHNTRLMNRQLDDEAAERLNQHAIEIGIKTELRSALKEVRVEKGVVNEIVLRDGRTLECDTLIVATGIRPNATIARVAGLAVGQGIKINDQLQTKDDNIYAIGECAQWQDQIIGLVAPGLEQAQQLAEQLTERVDKTYRAGILATHLKAVSLPVFIAGQVDPEQHRGESLIYKTAESYRRVFLEKGHIVGVMGVGEWTQQSDVKSYLEHDPKLNVFQLIQFLRTGLLPIPESDNPTQWADAALICNCKAITAGRCREAASKGNFEAFVESCGAGSVCGSCQPLLAQFEQQDDTPLLGAWAKHLFLFSFVVGLLAIAHLLLPPLPVATTIDFQSIADLWQRSFIRQYTGFFALGLIVISLWLSMAKRSSKAWVAKLGTFKTWRTIHLGFSMTAFAVLIVHTGLDGGQGINRWFWITTVIAMVSGALLSLASAIETRYVSASFKRLKRYSIWIHLFTLWPLPILLVTHVLSSYWF